MANHIFTYGTLIIPQVMQAVCGMAYEHVSASIDGYSRYGIKNKVYPGITKDKDSMVDGVLYLNVDDEALKRIDYFESDEYERVTVSASLDSGKKVAAFVYVVSANKMDILTKEPWNLKKFKDTQLDNYLKNTRQLMRDF